MNSNYEQQNQILILGQKRLTWFDCNFNSNITDYRFEYVPTPLSADGLEIYIRKDLSYIVVGKTFNASFQALWIEVINDHRKTLFAE